MVKTGLPTKEMRCCRWMNANPSGEPRCFCPWCRQEPIRKPGGYWTNNKSKTRNPPRWIASAKIQNIQPMGESRSLSLLKLAASGRETRKNKLSIKARSGALAAPLL